jgi:molybdopterin converting factor small subunit
MKSTNTETTYTTNVSDEYLTVEQAAGTKYGLRTECRFDCQQIIAILRPWLLSWKESSGYLADDSYVDGNGVIWASQNWALDTDVQFIIKPDGPCLNEIRWMLNALVDCHVAAESVDVLGKYTGERIDFEELEKVATLPKYSMIKAAIQKLEACRELNNISIRNLDDAIASLKKTDSIAFLPDVTRS